MKVESARIKNSSSWSKTIISYFVLIMGERERERQLRWGWRDGGGECLPRKLYHPSACGLEISDIKERPNSDFREIMKIKESCDSSPSSLF